VREVLKCGGCAMFGFEAMLVCRGGVGGGQG
jgi:hypothetical protein